MMRITDSDAYEERYFSHAEELAHILSAPKPSDVQTVAGTRLTSLRVPHRPFTWADRLASHAGISRTEMLNRLLVAGIESVLSSMDENTAYGLEEVVERELQKLHDEADI